MARESSSFTQNKFTIETQLLQYGMRLIVDDLISRQATAKSVQIHEMIQIASPHDEFTQWKALWEKLKSFSAATT